MFDWKNFDYGALLKSQVIQGNIVALIGIGFTMAGHSLPPDQQSQLTDLLTKLAELITASGIFYSSTHRVIAQPEGQTTILPKKPPPEGQ